MSSAIDVKRHRQSRARGRPATSLTALVSRDTMACVPRKTKANKPEDLHPGTLATMGERLRYAREQCGIDSNDLTRRIGASIGYVSSLETGRRKAIDARYIWKISVVLGVTCDWLLGGRGPMKFDEAHPMHQNKRKPNLDRVLSGEPDGRWSRGAVAAAYAQESDRPPDVWRAVLDQLHSALDKPTRVHD